jgi:hypothetical protein
VAFVSWSAHITRLVIGWLQALASAECIKDPVGAQHIQVTYQYASTHAPRYGYGMHFAVRNSAHPESTTFLAANRIKSVTI